MDLKNQGGLTFIPMDNPSFTLTVHHTVDEQYKQSELTLSPYQMRILLADIIQMTDWTDKTITSLLTPKVNRDNLVDFATWITELSERENRKYKVIMTVTHEVEVSDVPNDFDPYSIEWDDSQIIDNHDDIEIEIKDLGHTDFPDYTFDEFLKTYEK